MIELGKCVVVVVDGEVMADVRVKHMASSDGEAKVDRRWVLVSYVGQIDGKLVWQQEEKPWYTSPDVNPSTDPFWR